MCIYIYIYIYIHTHAYVYIQLLYTTIIHIYIYIYVHTYIHKFTCIHIYIYIYPMKVATCLPHALPHSAASFMWGFGYNFTNYTFRKTLVLFRRYLARGVKFKGRCLKCYVCLTKKKEEHKICLKRKKKT